MKRNKFTLIELIVVIVVLGILAAIVIPNINSFSKDAKIAALEADARNIELAIDMFSLDHKGSAPTVDGTPVEKGEDKEEIVLDLLKDYLKKDSQFKDEVTFYLEDSGSVTYELNQNLNEEVIVGQNDGTPYEHIKDKKVEANLASDFNYVSTGNTTTITGYKGTSRDIVIPASIDGKPVTVIENYAFVPSSLGGRSGKSSVIATSIVLPDSINKIGDYSFHLNELTNVVLPTGIESIGLGSFGNNKLTEIKIPRNLTSIGGSAFNGSQNLKFYVDKQNTKYKDGSNNQGIYSKDGKTIVAAKEGVFGSSDYNKVTTIGDYAFYGNQLSAITIPNSVTSIGKGAFSINKIVTITIPNSVTNIGENAFSNNQLINLTLPDSITTIGSRAFFSNQIAQVNIPKKLTRIESQVFNSNQLTEITIPETVTFIGSGAFQSNQLTSVTIPNSVTTMQSLVFYLNENLKTVLAPSHLGSIADSFTSKPTINYY